MLLCSARPAPPLIIQSMPPCAHLSFLTTSFRKKEAASIILLWANCCFPLFLSRALSAWVVHVHPLKHSLRLILLQVEMNHLFNFSNKMLCQLIDRLLPGMDSTIKVVLARKNIKLSSLLLFPKIFLVMRLVLVPRAPPSLFASTLATSSNQKRKSSRQSRCFWGLSKFFRMMLFSLESSRLVYDHEPCDDSQGMQRLGCFLSLRIRQRCQQQRRPSPF